MPYNYLVWNLCCSMLSNEAMTTIRENSYFISYKAILHNPEIPVK